MSDVMSIMETSMINSMLRMNSIGQNMANANTSGYKREIAVQQSFNDHLKNSMADAVSTVVVGETKQRDAHNIDKVVDHKPGMLRHTGNPLDVSVEGNGYFEVIGNQGVKYTRNGSFTLDSYGRLVTQSGEAVNGVGGEIRLTSNDVYIDKQARLWSKDKMIAQLKLVKFNEPNNVTKLGGSGFLSDESNVKELSEGDAHVRQGYLETSNVNSMSEMINMISTMRQFEMSQRIVKGYDEILDTAIKTLGEI